MASFKWPSEDGWPYPDEDQEAGDPPIADYTLDPQCLLDDDLVMVHGLPATLLEGLDPIERLVISARFGVAGQRVQSMKELHIETGLPRSDLRHAMGTGLAKLRSQMA